MLSLKYNLSKNIFKNFVPRKYREREVAGRIMTGFSDIPSYFPVRNYNDHNLTRNKIPEKGILLKSNKKGYRPVKA